MSNFNLETLFPSKNSIKNKNGKLDLNTLFKSTENENYEFDSSILLKNKELIEKKLEKCYMKYFVSCCDKIKVANEHGIVDIFFQVSDFIPEITEYKPLNCLLFIQNKLNLQSIDTHIYSNNTLFITWSNLESKISKKFF
jgi:hypothetical protein